MKRGGRLRGARRRALHAPTYRWNTGDDAGGLKTIVTWTPVEDGTLVRMEQSGFRPQDEGGYKGMGGDWPRIVDGLERVAAGPD